VPSELELIRGLYRYNLRILREYQRAIWRLPVKERYRDRNSTYPSLVDIYLHILDDYRFWFIRAYTGRKFRDFPLGIRLGRAQAEQATREVERRVERTLGKLTPRDLDREIVHPVDRVPLTVRSMLLQMIHGDLQHKGELNALLWQIDVTPPGIDLPSAFDSQSHRASR
jgi:uncharacterized damage-inducible protein DinB